jgi:hypothetical protein
MAVDVGAAAPSGGLASRGGGLGDHVGQLLHGAEELLAWIGWQSCVASAARLSARSTPLRRGGVTFRPGRRPRMSVRRPWSTSSFPCAVWAAGGWVVRRCGLSASGGTSGWRSRKVVICALRGLASCGRCASCGISSGGLSSSSSLERPVFAPPIAFTASFSPALG